MDKILTVVIPTYNMEAYLNRTLDSLVISDERMRLLEVLVINDGSKDRSSVIAHEYEAKYPDTFHVIDKENGHYGSCVNRGIQEARGKFFRLLDADDWFNNDQLEFFVDALSSVSDEVDVVFNNVYIHRKEAELVTMQNALYNHVYSFDEFDFRATHNHSYILGVQGITYRKALLENVHLQLQTGISYTDTEYGFYPLTKAKKFIFLECNLFNYFLGRDGQSIEYNVVVKNFDNFRKLSNRILPDYLKLASSMSATRKRNVLLFVYNAIIWIYLLNLRFLPEYDVHRMDVLKETEKYVRREKHLNWMMLAQRHKHIPYVLLWRLTGMRLSRILNFIGTR